VNSAPQLSSLGKYRLIATIGHGGMAHIYLALMAGPAGFNKLLVIKALRDDIGTSADEFVTMFLDEARLAARLNHPNIVQTYEVGEVAGRYFIAMEYLEGQSLKTVERRVRATNPQYGLAPLLQLRILSEVAKGLHHAHELRGFDGEPLGVVHRDISPHNVFLTYDGQVKLLDFGIAKAANAMHLTKVGVIKGKAEYIAPEQIRGEHVDRRADVFALGVMLWEALIGKRFAGGPEQAEITKMHNRLTGGEPRVSQLRNDLPHALIDLCDRTLSLSPEERPPTALAFAREIDTYFQSAGVNPGASQLAEAMAPLFQKERDQLRKLIDQQMKAALGGQGVAFDAGTHQLPVLPRQQFSSGIWQAPPPSSLAPGGAPFASGAPPYEAGQRSAPNTGSIGTPTSSRTHSISFQTSGLSIADRAFAAAPPPRRVPWPAVAGLVVVAVSVGTFLAIRPARNEAHAGAPEPAAAAPVEPAPVAPAPAPAAASAEDTVKLAIRVDRPDAEVMLDGARIRSLPFVGEMARDSKVHTLVVSAPGRQNHREMLTYDRDLEIDVALDAPAARRRVVRSEPREPEPAVPAPVAEAAPPVAPPPVAGVARAPETIEPGMDIERLSPRRRNLSADVVLEEDPYQ
jgi:serine/threonine protein kinase